MITIDENKHSRYRVGILPIMRHFQMIFGGEVRLLPHHLAGVSGRDMVAKLRPRPPNTQGFNKAASGIGRLADVVVGLICVAGLALVRRVARNRAALCGRKGEKNDESQQRRARGARKARGVVQPQFSAK
jgi:hypothetical protein